MSRKIVRNTSVSAAMLLATLAYAQPTLTEDLGVLVNNTPITRAVTVDPASPLWYKLTLPLGLPAGGAGEFLDIRTHGAGGTITDTELGLYDSLGNLIISDDDDGPGLASALSFGASCPTRANVDAPNTSGVAFNGRDGTLAAGEYYLAVVRYNATFSSPWGVTTTGTTSGPSNVDILYGTTGLEAPSITAATANPTGASEGQNSLFTATIAASCSGATITSVQVDLSSIGGLSTQDMYDDGTNGDAVAGNGVYSFLYTVPVGATPGPATLPVTATNSNSLTANRDIAFVVYGPPAVLTPDGSGVYTEVEDNDNKSRANIITTMTNGQVITGESTGTSTTLPGLASSDNFRIKTAPAAPGIYLHEMTLTSGTHTGTLRGLTQSSGVINAGTDAAIQTSSTASSPARTNRWYGFGMSEEVYYRVTGTTSTTLPYTSQYSVTPVSPLDAGTLAAGDITIDRATGNTSDMDFYVYDSNFNPVFDAANDGQNSLTRNYAPGVYYVAWSNFNTANDQPAASDDTFRSSSVMDFPNVVANSSTTAITNLDMRLTDLTGAPVVVPNSHSFFGVTWVRFTVETLTTPTNPNGTGLATPSTVLEGNGSLLTVTVNPGLNPASTGLAVVADLSAVGGLSNQAFFDDGTNGDVSGGDNIFSYALASTSSAGAFNLPFTVSDDQARSSNGSIALNVSSVTTLGMLPVGDTNASTDVPAAQVTWFRFEVPAINAGDLRYLDISTTAGPDTEIGVYDASGNLMDSDDDDGNGALSALSYGVTSPTRPLPGGTAFNGRDGELLAGTYYLAVGTFNTNFNATNWNVTSTGPGGAGIGVLLTHGHDINPHVTGNPANGAVGGTVLLTATASSGVSPPSTTLAVQGDLSLIGGSSTQAFFDDGTNGDVSAGDLVFSYLATIPHSPAQAPGLFNVPVTVTDDLARTGNGIIPVTLSAEPTGGCCTAGACSVTTEFNCVGGGGSYNGNGTDCGNVNYAMSDGGGVFSSIAGTGTLLTGVSSCDDCSELVNLPFEFNMYGTPYTQARVITNGNVQFGASNSTTYINGPIPSAGTPNDALYPLWDDYNPLEQGDIYVQEFGTAPNRSFVIEWNNVTQYTALGSYPLTSETFQVVLFEGTNNVEFRYGLISPINTTGIDQGTGQDASGGDATIGIENASGSAAVSIPSTGFTGTTQTVTFSQGNPCAPVCGTADFDGDGDTGTDADIEAFFACLAGNCCATCYSGGSDFDADGDAGTDADIESFFRVLSGGPC